MLDSSPPPQPSSGVYIGLPAELAPAGSYDRLSSLSPTHDSFSPENQRRLNHDAAVRNGEHIASEFEFSDLDLSGRKNVYRPGFEKAIRTLLDGRGAPGGRRGGGRRRGLDGRAVGACT